MLRSMFMRRACVVSLLLVSCFDGGNASGLPCNSNAECGNEMCIDGFCGGPQTTGGTTPSTSETESMTTLATNTDPTTTETDPSSTEPSTTMTTMADTTADTTGSTGDTNTGDPFMCDPPPPPPGECANRDLTIAAPVVSSVDAVIPEVGRPISITSGMFLGDDDAPDIAVLSLDPAQLVLVQNDNAVDSLGDWDADVTVLDGPLFTALQAYDVVVGDLACDGGTVFAFAGQAALFGFIGWGSGQFGPQFTVEGVPGQSFSLTLADVIDDGDNALDAVIAGNTHVTVMRNATGFYDAQSIVSFTDDGAPFAEPWDVQVIGSGSEARILVPEGDETDVSAPGDQRVWSLRYDQAGAEVELANPQYVADYAFRNPWAMAVGNFLGDDADELAVAERNVDDATPPGEGTNTNGMIRFYSISDTNALAEVGSFEVGIGVNSLGAANFDCDEYMDLVIGNGGASMPSPQGGTPEVLFGAATDDAMSLQAITHDDVSPSSRIAIADFDRDGRPEAAFGDYGLPNATNRVVFVDVN